MCGLVLVAAIGASTGCSAGAEPEEGTPLITHRANAAPAEGTTFVAHRGAAALYPESSLEAFRALAGTDFPIEFDLRPLADGTLVLQHDRKVERTLIGLSGEVNDLSPQEWKAAKIFHPAGGTPGTTTTWEEVLDAFGGHQILVPQLEVSQYGYKNDDFIESITSRGLEKSVIVQSFYMESAEDLADAGLTVL